MTPEEIRKEFKKLKKAFCCSGKEILLSDGILSGNAGIYKVGVDTSTGTIYYKDSTGTWVAVPSGGIITVTKAQADTLITNNTVKPGSLYKITGVHPTLYGGTDIFLTGLTTNKFSETGTGIFYNPTINTALADYGIWNNISTVTSGTITGIIQPGETINAVGSVGTATLLGYGFNVLYFQVLTGTFVGATSVTGATSGFSTPISALAQRSYSTGSKVVYGGYVWTNNAGVLGAPTNILTLDSNWTKVAYNTTDYTQVLDDIRFDYANNAIVMRRDLQGNIVDHEFADIAYFNGKGLAGTPINVFAWGHPLTRRNIVRNSYFESLNFMKTYAVDGNELNIKSIIAGNFMYNSSTLSSNYLRNLCEIRNNILIESANIYSNTLIGDIYSVCSINSNRLINNSYIYKNYLEDTSTINSNGLRRSSIYSNNVRYSSNINSNQMNENTAGIIRNVLNGLATINSNILRNVYVQAVASDRAFITGNVIYYGGINSNTLTVVFNGRTLNVCQNYLIGDANADTAVRLALIQGCAVTSATAGTYIRLCRLQAGQLLNANINQKDIVNLTLDNYVWDFGAVALFATLSDVEAKARSITATFSRTFANSAGNGAIGAVSIPAIQAPTGFFINEVIVDVSTALTTSGGILNLGIATDAPTAGLNATTGAVATLNSAGITKITAPTFTKATALRTLALAVTTAAVTAGTANFKVTLNKLV